MLRSLLLFDLAPLMFPRQQHLLWVSCSVEPHGAVALKLPGGPEV